MTLGDIFLRGVGTQLKEKGIESPVELRAWAVVLSKNGQNNGILPYPLGVLRSDIDA